MAAAEIEAVAPVTASSNPVVEATRVFKFPTCSINSGIMGMAILYREVEQEKDDRQGDETRQGKERLNTPASFQ